MNPKYEKLIENYRALLLTHKEGPQVAQWSPKGQLDRFNKLIEIGSLEGATVLDIGCGLGDLIDILNLNFKNFSYTGIDIVPELIDAAKERHPTHKFHCIDILEEQLEGKYDYILLSGIFNNSEIVSPGVFIQKMIAKAFSMCNFGVGFNFISTIHNYSDPKMIYYSPEEIFKFCIEKLSPKINFFHHYERCDVAVFIYK